MRKKPSSPERAVPLHIIRSGKIRFCGQLTDLFNISVAGSLIQIRVIRVYLEQKPFADCGRPGRLFRSAAEPHQEGNGRPAGVICRKPVDTRHVQMFLDDRTGARKTMDAPTTQPGQSRDFGKQHTQVGRMLKHLLGKNNIKIAIRKCQRLAVGKKQLARVQVSAFKKRIAVSHDGIVNIHAIGVETLFPKFRYGSPAAAPPVKDIDSFSGQRGIHGLNKPPGCTTVPEKHAVLQDKPVQESF